MTNSTLKIYEKIQKGEFHKALLMAEKAYQGNENDQEALVNYVSVLLRLGHLDKAETVLLAGSHKPVSSLSVYLLYQDLYCLRGDIDSLKKLQCLNPDFTIPENIEVLSTTGKKTKIRPDKSYFKNQLLDMLRILSNKYPEDSKVFKKAYNLIIQNEIEKGEHVLLIFAHNTKDKTLGKFIFAELELLDGRFKKAKKWYAKIIDDFRQKWVIYDRLGDICLVLGDEQEACAHYLKANKLNPEDINTHLDLIKACILKKDFKHAKKAFNQAVSRFGKERLESLRHVIEGGGSVSENFCVKGLCWYEGGGSVINIEMETQPGCGHVKPTGNLGFQLLDSVHIAHKVAKKIVSQKGKPGEDLDMLINLPNAVIYKDGSSAGLAFTVGMIGKLLNKPIPNDVAFTGEVSIGGDVIPIGGLEGKLTAAYLSNIQTVYMPKDNFFMLQNVPEKIKSKLKLKLVAKVKGVVENLWNI